MSTDAILKFDLNQLRQNAEKLVSIGRNTNVRFLLAVKAHAHPVLIDLFGGILSGFDISNQNEIELLPKNKNDFICSLCGPAFNIYDVNRLIAYEGKPRVILQSLRQFDILERTNYLLDYGIRLKTNDESRFGIEPNNLELIKKITNSTRHRFCGFHIHSEKENLDQTHYIAQTRRAFEIAKSLGLHIDWIDIGGGLETIGFTGLTTLIKEMREFIPHNIFLEFEPGRILGYQAGKAYAEVLDVVSTSEGWDITLNISAGCHLWWSKPKLVINEKPELGALLKKIRFFGPTCAENDCIGIFQLPTPYQIGDQVCFHNISTYSLMWNRQFNGVSQAKIIWEGDV